MYSSKYCPQQFSQNDSFSLVLRICKIYTYNSFSYWRTDFNHTARWNVSYVMVDILKTRIIDNISEKMKFSQKDQGHNHSYSPWPYITHIRKKICIILWSRDQQQQQQCVFVCNVYICMFGWACICEHIFTHIIYVSLFYIEMACNASVVNLHISVSKNEEKYHSIRIEVILEYFCFPRKS